MRAATHHTYNTPASSTSPTPSTAVLSVGRTVHVNGIDLHYRVHGSGPIKILFIMGLLTDGDAWKFQTDYFSRDPRYQCVSYDNRGVNRTSTPGLLQLHTYSTRQMARDALALVDHLGWEKMHIVGISMGGMIALELALAMSPYRILSLSLLVTHAGGRTARAPWEGIKQTVVGLLAKDEQAKLKSVLDVLYHPNTVADKAKLDMLTAHHLARIRQRIAPTLAAVLGHTLAVSRHWVSYSNLLRIRYQSYPVMVVVGDLDHLVRVENSHILARILGAKLVQIPNAGHGLLAEHTDTINQHLATLFDSVQSGSGLGQYKGFKSSSSGSGDGADSDVDVPSEDEYDESMGMDVSASVDECEVEQNTSTMFTLEKRALELTCSHNLHCSINNIAGFLQGFCFGFVFRYIFFDTAQALGLMSSAGQLTLSRTEQAIRFGLLIAAIRGGWRAIRCLYRTMRARQWAVKHQLIRPTRNNMPSSSSSAAETDEFSKQGIPQGAGFDVPIHSFVFLAAVGVVVWKKGVAGLF